MDDAEGFLRQKSQAVTESIDSKKWVWIEDKAEGYLSAKILEVNGETLSVEVNTGQRLTVKRDLTQQMNPTKYDKAEDMAALTYLNEAGVLNNLKQRYFSGMIYTYSGLFCVAVNPYRRLPIYTDKVVEMYKGKRRAEMPPHIFSITDNAYNEMLQERENQSILITGESGAGKTENTKKVIQYVATVAGTGETKSEKKQNLEDQIVQANPLMEAFGNAKTIRNNNSSRFGKFIRVHFGLHGKIAGADVESYLLEKSRVVSQTSEERNYHVFYQILTAADDQMKEKYLVTGKPEDYKFLSEGVARIDAVDDEEEWHATCDSMKTLRFTDEERGFLIKVVMAILHFGNVKFKQRPREEQAECPDTADAEKVAFLLGIQVADLVRSLLRPRIRVGHEYVQQGRNYEQVVSSVAALSKSLYDRMFKWLIARINKTLETKFSKNYFIGVLDIAGFEIFQVNLFEQLSINYTNEKLQQFFNHHMFILEQEEYKKENIDWEFIDFGHDLQPCIDLIEKKLGILSILDEESIYPKASDKTFIEKLKKNHDGKSPKFKLPKMSSKNKAHFEIEHYAGTVGYTVMGWLEKNKDPLNDSVVDLLRKSTDPIIASLFADHQPEGSRKKGSQFLTVSQLHKEQLEKLMVNLRNTTPHFVRCIIPNEKKKPGIIEANLVLHQLRCNGVLEGIRICRKGFPNRIIFSEFKQRYAILAPGAIPSGMFMDGRKAAAKLVDALQLEPNEFRMGTTKVFFRAGVIGRLEESRDEKLYAILSKFQARMRGFLMRKTFQKMQEQRSGLQIIQRNVRKYIVLRNWQWWRLFTKVKPLLNVARSDEELKHMQEEVNAGPNYSEGNLTSSILINL
ncbi:uncharacterized protein TRIADDRAFT_20764 [Trichoplax adhaerens]|uniref:Myosin motor domain-containing protein n=1 Tax=Trichoplax adhaerens TaxID=10228 RepID=B3RQ46_TRIAD|nr:hypothetical protein TRIADDRAFT_20764 [Trichoplax adhaerens]EDV27755.1 hypothetical protein TRIADDRAFT_20764 [Trichoplax adhaerens]|eukprot:XP_002109589.1 hypothetical protein TRIADDRAFT_20764 [Trichoplax adhaerens]